MADRTEVLVVGSGAGGGVIASELAHKGRKVTLLELGNHVTARNFLRFELAASRALWWPIRFAQTHDNGATPIAMVAGRCVGGGTTINTKIALRAPDFDFAKWNVASAPKNDHGRPLSRADLDPYYARVESFLGVRERADWPATVRTVERGFRAMGTELTPVHSYTNFNCTLCGQCLQGCPTNSGQSTMTAYIHPSRAKDGLDLRANCTVTRVVMEKRGSRLRATGVEYLDASGTPQRVDAQVVVVAAGTLNTPQLLLRSDIVELARGSASSRLVGKNLGTHTGRFVHGYFDEPQDNHMVYPLTAHCTRFQRDEDGGFLVEACSIMDPIALGSNLVDENMIPLWGQRLADTMKEYRNWAGLFMMTNDTNNGTVSIGPDGQEKFEKPIPPPDADKLTNGFNFCSEVLRAAGATKIAATGYLTSHVQGTCRMGSDPRRSVVNSHGESHDVQGLFIGDGSVIPRTLSVNPSLTIMALATRMADHIHQDTSGCFR